MEPTTPATPTPVATMPTSPKKNNLLIAIIVVALLLLIAGSGLAYWKLRQPTTITPPPTTTPPTTTPSPVTKEETFTPQNNQITLTVTSPVNGSTVKTDKITVTGATVPNADVSINDLDLQANSQGIFTTVYTLDPGENTIDIVASDEFGNAAEQELTINYDTL